MRLLLFLLFCTGNGYCQNYQCLQAGVERYFTNANGYLRGIRIDSVRTYGDSTIYYPFHTPRGAHGPGTDTLNPAGGSWLGRRVIAYTDGTFLFDNIWHDTVVVRTQASMGDSWLFFRDTGTSVYYKAQVAGMDTMMVAGVLDSIKKITVTTCDSAGSLAWDSLNNLQIVLSKSHGFVQVMDLFTFPYAQPGLINSSPSDFDLYADLSTGLFDTYTFNAHNRSNTIFRISDFRQPTIAELYNWNIGDEYEYAIDNGILGSWPVPPWFVSPIEEYDVDLVTNRSFPVPDSVQYVITGTKLTFNGVWDPSSVPVVISYAAAPDTMFVNAGPGLLIDTALEPEELGQTAAYYYFPSDTSYCFNGALYGISVTGLHGAIYFHPFEATYPISAYKAPLGLVNTHQSYIDGYIYRQGQKLIYYRRGGSVCGMQQFTGVKTIGRPMGVQLFPNPTHGALTVNTGGSGVLEVYTIVGQRVVIFRVGSGKTDIMLPAALSSGLYLGIFTPDDGGARSKVRLVYER